MVPGPNTSVQSRIAHTYISMNLGLQYLKTFHHVHCTVQIKFKLRRKGSCEDQANKKMEQHERNTDESQEWCEIWVISFCFTTRVIWNTSDITLLHSKIWIQESHTELSSFFNQVYGTYSSFYQLYGHIRRVYTVNLRHEPPHLPLGCGWHHKLQHSHDDSLKDFGLGLK